MCGRLACGLEPEQILNSCCYKDPVNNKFVLPEWRDCYNSGITYSPSFNICPKEVAPVLLSGNHFKIKSRILAPMVFGVVPEWLKGVESKYSTINCRIETAKVSMLYGNLLEKGQRCAVICNGFYEWHNQKQHSGKKPYFIHCLQPDGVQIDDKKSWNINFASDKGFSGFRPLKLAALFEINSYQSLEKATLSFSVITKEADLETSWLHHRVPAILETDEQLDAWLNYEKVDADEALKHISNKASLICVPVSSMVNQVANKDISCVKQKRNFTGNSSEGFLRKWLERKHKRKNDDVLGSAHEKIIKGDL